MKIKSLSVSLLIVFLSSTIFSQEFTISKIEPPNWWSGMKWNKIQLMVYGENLNDVTVSIPYPRINLGNVSRTDNKNYLFIDVEIPADLHQGEYEIIFRKEEKVIKYNYPVLNREFKPEDHKGFSNEDVIYLIFADRFCDGNSENNTIGDSLDEFTSADLDGRHGGDIEGIISKLDYLYELGVTAIWITPILENNMWMSYHGYAATDLYKIDPRFGTNELYKKLVAEAHKRGLKIILDHVSNHIGINHYWIQNLPSSDWLNGTPENHLPAMHDKMAYLDVHGDSTIIGFTQRGWFENYMPDLNQENPFLKNYLIQNTLWWIEYSGLDGIREDTYPYANQKYLSDWADAIQDEYPEFNIVGEIWQGVPSIISGYQSNSPVRKVEYDSHLPAVTDFALSDAIRSYLSGEKNIYPVYETITQDIVYSDPDNLVTFMDNHDIIRALFIANGNVDKLKIALNLLLFTRGIPVLFYGTEIGITGGRSHGELRQPYPGGFEGDKRSAFTPDGRGEKENEIYNYLTSLLKIRKEYPVLAKGKLHHIYVGGDLYILLKTYGEETALILLNTGGNKLPMPTSQLKIFLNDFNTIRNLKTGEEINLNQVDNIMLSAFNAEIYLLKK